MKTACAHCPLRCLPQFQPMSEADVEFMQVLKRGEMVVDPGTTLFVEGASSPQLYTVLSGMGLRYKTLEDGRRQVVNFVFPGDYLGLQSAVMGEMRHSIEASTPMVLCVFNRTDLWEIFRNHPERAFSLTWLGSVEEHFLSDALATLGQREAYERVAWALYRIWSRLAAMEMVRDGSVPLPYRQRDLADAVGLSLVHTNKTLAKLRGAGIADWRGGRLYVTDPLALAKIGALEPDHIELRPLF
ncbi:Crp/Fnr family transcriptional regulator [Phaeovulum sp. W22_SRMD_FR3]|uniref:Crp/Fnr family transcriptional regulator n=1 Tax=Phaeovulum sp. W22_SRMD_FR3 TaxID=3240274 RepID=UPI003F94899F